MPLSIKERQFLISGLIGEYEYLCHDDSEPDDMTPAEHYAVLLTYSDDELIADSDLIDSPYESAEEFYDTHSSYRPYEYQIDWASIYPLMNNLMTFLLLPFFLASFIIDDNDSNYIAQCIKSNLIWLSLIVILSVDNTRYSYLLFYTHNHTMQASFLYANDYNSSAVESVGISEATNQVKVTFNGGKTYLYSNVCSDCIYQLTLGSVKSLGKWVSEALVNNDVDYLQLAWGYALITNSFFIHLIYPLMFNPFAINTVQRPSAAVNNISTDLVNAEVYVEYSNGEAYVYTNVSRRAILNLLLQDNISLGFWVNHNLLYCDAKCATFGSCEHLAQFA